MLSLMGEGFAVQVQPVSIFYNHKKKFEYSF